MKPGKQLQGRQLICEAALFVSDLGLVPQDNLKPEGTEQMQERETMFLGALGQLSSCLLLLWPRAITALATGAKWALH